MNTVTAQPSPQAREPSPYRWTVDRFYRALDAGIFDHPERLELIRGELIEKAGQSPAHASLVDLLTRRLRARLEPRFTVREEKPLHIADDGEPIPDIMVVVGNAADYIGRHPSPSEVVLLLEVSDSSSPYDTRDKAMLYAQAGITEYWVASVLRQEIVVYRKPTSNGYAFTDCLGTGDAVSPLSAPETTFTVQELFDR